VASVPIPSEDISPMPVTTTRLLNLPPAAWSAVAPAAPVRPGRLPPRRYFLVLVCDSM
jgi:hypothetical protein